MSGRGGSGGRGGGRGGRGRGRGSTGTALMGREMLKRSATEAGLLGKGKIGDPGNAFFADIMRPAGPLYGPFLWHSNGNVRQDDSTNDANNTIVGVGVGSVGGAGLMTIAASSATPDAAMSNTSAAAAAAASAAKGNRKAPPITVTKRTPSMTFLVSRQRELMERFQASTHHVRIHPQIDVARYNSNNNNNTNNATPPDVAIRQESMSKKLAKDERYIPVEILYPSAASLAMSRSNMIEANKKKKRQQELDELEKQELGGGSSAGFGGGGGEEEDEDDDNNDEFEEPPEEQEEGEDYTTNYYDTEDESAGGDGDEATF